MRTVFLGNGIVAMTAAFRLLRRAAPSDEIAIVGPTARPGSATLAAAAMLNSFGEVEAGSLKSEIDRFRFEISRQATSMWPAFERELAQQTGSYKPELEGRLPGGCAADGGTYIVNNTYADDLDDENFEAIVAALEHYSEPFDVVSPRDIPNYAPMQKFRAARAIHIRGEGWYNPRIVLDRLDFALQSPRVRRIDAEISRLVLEGGIIKEVVLSNGDTIEGDIFVLATGANTSEVLEKSNLGIKVQKVFFGIGTSIEIRSSEFLHKNCVRTPNRGLACGVYSVPYAKDDSAVTDHIIIGASNFVSPVPQFHGRLTSVETLMRAAIEQVNENFYRADLIGVNLGWRPTSQDTYPMIGRSSIANLIIATATKRDGFHLSPWLSDVIADLVQGKTVDERLNCFAPERKLIRSLSRREAVEKATRHLINSNYQHGYNPATSRMPADIAEMYRGKLEELHDKVGATDWGIPPEMLDMYKYGHAKP